MKNLRKEEGEKIPGLTEQGLEKKYLGEQRCQVWADGCQQEGLHLKIFEKKIFCT